jgi:hypothetical protein
MKPYGLPRDHSSDDYMDEVDARQGGRKPSTVSFPGRNGEDYHALTRSVTSRNSTRRLHRKRHRKEIKQELHRLKNDSEVE